MMIQRMAKKTVENIVKRKGEEEKCRAMEKRGEGERLQTKSEAEVKCGLQEAIKV